MLGSQVQEIQYTIDSCKLEQQWLDRVDQHNHFGIKEEQKTATKRAQHVWF